MKKKIKLLIHLLIDGQLGGKFLSFYRRIWLRLFYGISIGKGTIVRAGLEVHRFAELEVGNNGFIGKGVAFEVGRVWENCQGVSIGNRVWISRNCLLQCMGRISIGSDVMIGEMSSIRDTRHSTKLTTHPMKQQSDIIGFVNIEDDVWIGRGSLILGSPKGLILGKGCVVGANSVVTKSVPEYEIWGGVPAKFIRKRV